MNTINSLELFKKLLSYRSNTPDDDGALDFIEEYLSDFKCIKVDKGGVKNRLYFKDFSKEQDKKAIHLCFGGHIDVVPAGKGWDSEPFTPVIDGDIITARGTQDMKSGINAFIQVLKKTKDFNGILSLLITSDEEGPAINGTVVMLEHLKQIGFLPTFAIIAEPTCESVFGDTIKIGRRGSINGLIEISGTQGHAAYPEKTDNPIHKIAPLLHKIANVNLDNGDENFACSTLIITDIRGGMEVTNVTPDNLRLMFNIRNSTKTNQENVKDFVANIFKDINYTLKLEQSAYPFITNRKSKIVKTLQELVQKHTSIKPTLSTAGGTSDARFFGEFGIDTVEFGVKNDKIHAINESTSIKDVFSLEKIFFDMVQKIGE